MASKVKIGITDKSRAVVARILNTTLADEYVLYTKTRNFHWNVVGPQFHDLHKFFEAQYDELNDIVDEVAERARALGGRAHGSLAEFSKNTRLKERAPKPLTARDMLAELTADHEAVIRSLRVDLVTCADQGDAGTNDFLTGVMEKHEKMAWMLRSCLEARSA